MRKRMLTPTREENANENVFEAMTCLLTGAAPQPFTCWATGPMSWSPGNWSAWSTGRGGGRRQSSFPAARGVSGKSAQHTQEPVWACLCSLARKQSGMGP